MNSSKSSGPIRRARQSDLHLALKEQVGKELEQRGFEVLYEHNLVDVVGFHLGEGWIVAVEVELTARNLPANLIRNLRTGFSHILIVAPTERALDLYNRKVGEHAANAECHMIRVVSPAGIENALDGWFVPKS